MAILDQFGKPIKMSEVTAEPQTARVGSLHHEFAAHPTRGLTPYKLASILEEAEQGDLLAQCDLFDDMEEKDAHIFAEMQKRKLALLGLEWDIVPPRNASPQEEKAAGLVKEMLQDQANFEDVILDMASAIGHGYSCLEMAWQRQGREWLPSEISFRPQRWFTLDRETRTELLLRNTALGDPLQPFTWIVHRHQARSGYLSRSGLHRVLAWPFLFKNYSLRDLAEFLEIYGLPLRVGTYPAGADDREKATLLSAVVNIGHAAAGIIPEGMSIEFKEAAKGAADPFEAMMSWCERSQSKAILGGTLTSQADGKSSTNALGNVHNEVRHDLLVADARQLAGTLTRDLVYPLIALNTSGIDGLRRCPRFVFDTTEPEDLSLYSEAVPKLVGVGMRIPARWAHEKLRIPEAEGNEPVLAAPAAAPAFATAKAHATAALKGTEPADAAHPSDPIAERLTQETSPAMAAWLARIEAMLAAAGSLEEFRQMLLAAYANLPEDDLAEVLGDAMTAAEAAGRFDVEVESGGN